MQLRMLTQLDPKLFKTLDIADLELKGDEDEDDDKAGALDDLLAPSDDEDVHLKDDNEDAIGEAAAGVRLSGAGVAAVQLKSKRLWDDREKEMGNIKEDRMKNIWII